MIINRDKYLNQLINKIDNGMVKIITGVKESGKTYLLFELFTNYLTKSGVKEDHIIKIELDNRLNIELRDPDKILKYITNKILDNKQYYLIIDEIQYLNEFEDVLNTTLHIKNLDTYVTGSNSKFLAKDVITEFRGRGDEIHVTPLTFKEFLSVYKGSNASALKEYMRYGGLPKTVLIEEVEEKENYLKRLFRETYIKDIEERYNIEKKLEMDDLIKIIASSVGSLTNPTKIEKTFKSVYKSDITINTINSYLEYLEESYLITKTLRYDVKGRKYIGTPSKYYFTDLGLRNAKLDFRQTEETHLMENLIYNELKYRGFNIDIGVINKKEKDDDKYKTKQLEVDFIATKGSKKYYIQSAYNLDVDEKEKQEKRPLQCINDSFKKIIIVNSEIQPTYQDDSGIYTMNIYDFLLNEKSLEVE